MYPNQTPAPNEPPQGYYSVGGGTDDGRKPSREGIFKWVKRGLFGVTVLAIIGGTLLGMNHFFGVAQVEREKLAAARAANDAAPEDKKVYFGDGSDIAEVAQAETIVACPSGYEDKSGTCEKSETRTANPAVYSCPGGYQKKGSGASTSCVKIVGGTTESKPANQTQTCPAGYEKSGSTCNKIETVDANINYSCPSGYQVSGSGAGTKCTKTGSQPGTVVVTCPSSYWASGSGLSTICYYTKPAQSGSEVTGYACDSGDRWESQSASLCAKLLSRAATYGCPSVGVSYTSGPGVNGARLSASSISYCYFRTTYVSGIRDYQCLNGSRGYVSGASKVSQSSCSIRTVSRGNYGACPDGTNPLNDTQCKSIYTASKAIVRTFKHCNSYPDLRLNSAQTECYKTGAINTNCQAGFAKSGSGSGTVCIKIDISNVSANTSRSCPGGYTDRNGKCEKTVSANPLSSYACGDGYRLAGTQCTRVVGGREEKTNPGVSYACPDDYVATGSGASMKCEKVETSTAEKEKQFVCKDGWIKRQSGESFDCVLLRA